EPEVKYPEVEPKAEISIDDFDKVQLRVGEVIKCEPVPKAKKLLCSQIRIGNEVRQIVSGIAMYYKPEEMVGKKVAVITNLKPVKLCGVLSEGMILAVSDDEGNLSVLTVDKDIVAGSEIC
ncbi:MAG: methionine--tRNA ligase subunit beta, partial [Lachnospiraceae bacterium]|nr:methionine--tRNA ligase subunit beta [Lachnospiraceae bacterium]